MQIWERTTELTIFIENKWTLTNLSSNKGYQYVLLFILNSKPTITMRKSTKQHSLFMFLLLSMFANSSFANDPVYEQRRTDYINHSLANFSRHTITIQAYMGVPVDSATLHQMVGNIAQKSTADFDIVQLVRILCLSSGQYDSIILPALDSIPFWLTKGDTLRGYWSENHMIQWMSSNWLLHERFGKSVDANLDNRLRHYLRLKVKYGFYEFFSTTYAPYSLSGLLNLADFAQDVEIKTLATLASQRLLKELLMITNDQGVLFPTAGRNYFGKYDGAYDQNHNNLIYLLTGFGDAPTSASHAGGFLASSSLPVDSITASWTSSLDITYPIGHTLDTSLILNSGQSQLDRTMFQWSFGGYFDPRFAGTTGQLLIDSNLWKHVDFEPFVSFSLFDSSTIVALAQQLTVASKSTVICKQDAKIFKHKSITLSSVKDFWKGKLGYQQFPCVANLGTTAVYTASGQVKQDWDTRSSSNLNDNLPYVGQEHNVALLMYRPEFKSPILPSKNPEVALHFNAAEFDEVLQDSLWLLGRQANQYVAVRRHCLDSISNVAACYMDKGQTWVIIVGDSAMYGTFNQFKTKVDQATFQERWYMDTVAQPNQYVYYAKINFDTTTVEYAWGVDSVTTTGIKETASTDALKIYPNPSSNKLNIDLSAIQNKQASIQVTNMFGQVIYSEKRMSNSSNNKTIYVSDWPSGTYTIAVETAENKYVKQFLKNE